MTGADWIDLLQWPAMLLTVVASWFVAAPDKRRRSVGFWLFLVSNAVWVVWAVPAHAYALAVLQVCLAAMNIRGVLKAEPGAGDKKS